MLNFQTSVVRQFRSDLVYAILNRTFSRVEGLYCREVDFKHFIFY